MNRVIRLSILVAIILSECFVTQAQTSFEVILQYPVVKWSPNCIEDADGNFITLISERTGNSFGPGTITKAYLFRITPDGDTSSIFYSFGDTLFNFNNITRIQSGGYLIIGQSQLPDSEEIFLFLMKVNPDFEPVWTRHHSLNGYFSFLIRRIFNMRSGFILAGAVCNFPCASIYPYFARTNETGDIINTYIYPDNTVPDEFEYLMTNDSSQIWLLSSGGLDPINEPSRAVFDTSFNYMSSDPLSSNMHSLTALWNSDSSFIVSYDGQRPGSPYQDDELMLRTYDESLNILQHINFGYPDTADNPGERYGIDFRHPDTIFFAGNKNDEIGPPSPGWASWIMTGQTNAQLQPRYLHFFGGDESYETYYIKAASDGGSLICANKWNPEWQVYDLFFLKLNREGLLTGDSDHRISLKKAMLWPNPTSDEIMVQTALKNVKLTIFNSDGNVAYQIPLSGILNRIDISHLTKGLYIYSIITPDGYSENGKLIKQ